MRDSASSSTNPLMNMSGAAANAGDGGTAAKDAPAGAEIARSASMTDLPPEKLCPYLVRVLGLLILCAGPAFTFGVLFTSTGYGVDVINELNEFAGLSRGLLATGLFILLVLYVGDFSYWKGCWWYMKTIVMAGALVLAGSGVVLSAKSYPQMPLMMYLLITPGYFLVVKTIFWKDSPNAYFLASLSVALFVTGVVGIFWWAYDINTNNDGPWPGDDCEVRCGFYSSLSCPGVIQMGPAGTNFAGVHNGTAVGCPCLSTVVERDHNCELAAFLVYTSLFVASTAVIIFSFVLNFLSRSMLQGSAKRASRAIRVFGTLVSLGVLGMWVAAQIGGADMALSNVVMSFSAAFVFMLVCVIGASIGWQSLDKELTDVPLIASMKNSFASDYLKAFGVFLLPVYAMFVALSFLNQIVRLYMSPCAKDVSHDDKKLWVTQICHKQLVAIKNWPWTSVLNKVMFLGIFYFSFSVIVGKLTYILLSWVNEQLATSSLGVVTVIFFLIGLTMFLLPPVPGAPVYLVGGVMLTKTAWREWGADSNAAFWGGAMFTTLICFLLKYCAIAGQQKGFGERLGTRVGIRKAVGVNSITIKAIKKILSAPGLSLGKVCILIGGPDWPTSVLTGILHLSLPAMLFGSAPVIFLVTPTVLAGALMLRTHEGGIYSSLGSMFLALCALVQAMGMFAAMYYIEDVSAKFRKELEEEPKDMEVLAEEKKDEAKKVVYDRVTAWGVMPAVMKFNVILGAVWTALYCYMFGLAGSQCFESYNITDTIDDRLEGDMLNVVKPNKMSTGKTGFGWYGLALFALAFVHKWIFGKWAACRVAAELKRLEREGGGLAAIETVGAEREAKGADVEMSAPGGTTHTA